ncbi:hypothetical protein M405DRAFT_841765 [Rhizopogon salebrosus TDB-379]|nr:hypothetical protein M405DRAFT_841765 [Rhizopogon salebrosus TDB-379]
MYKVAGAPPSRDGTKSVLLREILQEHPTEARCEGNTCNNGMRAQILPPRLKFCDKIIYLNTCTRALSQRAQIALTVQNGSMPVMAILPNARLSLKHPAHVHVQFIRVPNRLSSQFIVANVTVDLASIRVNEKVSDRSSFQEIDHKFENGGMWLRAQKVRTETATCWLKGVVDVKRSNSRFSANLTVVVPHDVHTLLGVIGAHGKVFTATALVKSGEVVTKIKG